VKRFPLVAALAVSALLSRRAAATELFSSLDALAGQLKNGDSVQRREAVDKLDAYGADEARPLLLRALADSDTEVRAHAATAIGRHHVVEATAGLTAALGDSDSRLRASAAEALGLVLEGPAANDPPAATLRAVDALERALGDGEHEVREAARSGACRRRWAGARRWR
jgi:HEAT repeat protein